MESFPLYLLIIETIIILFVDSRLFRTILTPSLFLIIPYLLIVIVSVVYGKELGLVPLHYNSLYVWIIGILPFWVSGILLRLIISGPLNKHTAEIDFNQKKWISILFKLIILFFMYKFIIVLKGGYLFGTKQFGERFFGSGIIGHIANLLFIIFPYLTITTKKLLSVQTVFSLLLLFLITSYGSKTWLLTVSITTLLLFIHYKRIKLSLFTLIVPIFVGFGIFTLIYSFTIKNNLLDFATRHFIDYLTSGILPLSEFVKNNSTNDVDPAYLFSPFVNTIHAIRGHPLISPHSNIQILTDTKSNFESNVFTLFGTIYIYGGKYWGTIVSFLLGFLNYGLLLVVKLRNNLFNVITYYFAMSLLFWGWFNCSFILMRPWEILVLSLLLGFVSRLSIQLPAQKGDQTAKGSDYETEPESQTGHMEV